MKQLLVLAGPTAVGKTALSIAIAQHYNCQIVSCDSRQVYRELGVAVAKPSREELELVPHHFINHCSIHEPYNAGTFETEALQKLDELYKTDDVVLMVGGTGLYIKAVTEGFDPLPQADETLRMELSDLYQEQGISGLQERLKSLDPEAKLEDMMNPQRLIRAIEILVQGTGNLHQQRQSAKSERPFKVKLFYMNRPRPELYERINQRVDQMVEQGLVKEAEALFAHRDLQALQTVGYSELFKHFSGEWTLEQAIDKIKQHSRNYAKRQLTWFKNQGFTELPIDKLEALRFIEKSLDA